MIYNYLHYVNARKRGKLESRGLFGDEEHLRRFGLIFEKPIVTNEVKRHVFRDS